MTDKRQRKLNYALMVLLLVLAACKSESPTAPPIAPSAPTTPGGGVTPPTNAQINLTASNPTPLVNSTSVITATVTIDGQPAPNGTAVQFSTSAAATFTDAGVTNCGSTTITIPCVVKTTTNGAATVTLTSTSAGTVPVTAVVNNVSKTINVTFQTQAVTPPPPNTTPTITSVCTGDPPRCSPATGRPEGGDIVVISGTNFREPVRVLFDPGAANGAPKEGFVSSVTPTQITVVTPRFDVPTGSTLTADVIVITQAGSPSEQRVTKAAGFTFTAAVLTPVIRAVQPSSGPVNGGTRVTIIGDNFQAPVQVFFGSAEAQVLTVQFQQIIVMSPTARDTSPNGSGVVTGPVDVRVVNVGSNKSVTMTNGFRYIPKMQITTVVPGAGPFTGGTRMSIDGTGFVGPVAVVVRTGQVDVPAQVISVSGTEIVAITGAVQPTSCGNVAGQIIVTNTDNGDSAQGPNFTFLVPRPVIVSIVPNPQNLGQSVTITVANAIPGDIVRITVGGVAVNITGVTQLANGALAFTVQLPSSIPLNQQSCAAGGSAPLPTSFDVVYTSATTQCTDTSTRGITINPPTGAVLFANPAAFQPFQARITPGVAPAPTTVAPSAAQTISIVNTGTSPMDVTAISQNGAGCSQFSIIAPPIPPTVTLNQCESLPIIVTFNGQTVPSTAQCTITVTTSAGSKSFLLIGASQ